LPFKTALDNGKGEEVDSTQWLRATAMHHQLPADWIVLDQNYPAHHAVRTATLKQYRPLCFVIERDPAVEAAKLEAALKLL